ncbi:hypothetical protein SB717_34385, partial [Priestia sp. SIMBA_032]
QDGGKAGVQIALQPFFERRAVVWHLPPAPGCRALVGAVEHRAGLVPEGRAIEGAVGPRCAVPIHCPAATQGVGPRAPSLVTEALRIVGA